MEPALLGLIRVTGDDKSNNSGKKEGRSAEEERNGVGVAEGAGEGGEELNGNKSQHKAPRSEQRERPVEERGLQAGRSAPIRVPSAGSHREAETHLVKGEGDNH